VKSARKLVIWHMYVSGALSVLLLIPLLTGWADADYKAKSSLRLGNERYASGAYTQALGAYETGLEARSEDSGLITGAAQSAYMTCDYEKAVKLFEKADDSVEKYLNYGNAFYYSGASLEDAGQKARFYAQAALIYKEGIIKYPRDVTLKFNYEFVKAELQSLQDETKGSGEIDESGESDESSENGESGENAESGEGENNEEQESGGAGDNEQNEENGQDQQDEKSEQDGQDKQDEQDKQKGQDDTSGQDDPDTQGEEEQDALSSREESDGNGADKEAIARILEALESKEEESLKNNQRVKAGKAEGNGW